MATPQQIAAFINHCPRHLSNNPGPPQSFSHTLREKMTPSIIKCCHVLLEQSVNDDVFLEILNDEWPMNNSTTQDIYLAAVKAILNLRKILGNCIPMATFFDVETIGITATVDILLKSSEFMVCALDFTDTRLSTEDLRERRPLLQAITRAYNAQKDHEVNTMCLIAPVVGQSVFYTYDKYDMSEYVGQALDQGMAYRRYCDKCGTCINKELCTIAE